MEFNICSSSGSSYIVILSLRRTARRFQALRANSTSSAASKRTKCALLIPVVSSSSNGKCSIAAASPKANRALVAFCNSRGFPNSWGFWERGEGVNWWPSAVSDAPLSPPSLPTTNRPILFAPLRATSTRPPRKPNLSSTAGASGETPVSSSRSRKSSKSSSSSSIQSIQSSISSIRCFSCGCSRFECFGWSSQVKSSWSKCFSWSKCSSVCKPHVKKSPPRTKRKNINVKTFATIALTSYRGNCWPTGSVASAEISACNCEFDASGESSPPCSEIPWSPSFGAWSCPWFDTASSWSGASSGSGECWLEVSEEPGVR